MDIGEYQNVLQLRTQALLRRGLMDLVESPFFRRIFVG
jgi:hypothetical protein